MHKLKTTLLVAMVALGITTIQAQTPSTPTPTTPTPTVTTPSTTTTTTPTPTTAPTDSTSTTTTTSTTQMTTNGNGNFTDPAQAITVQQSSPTFVIRLKSNRTTGYSWFVKDLNHDLVKLESHAYKAPQDGMPGEGGYEEWTFMLKPAAFTKPTTTHIKLIYGRPWEKREIAKKLEFKVVTQ